MMRFGLQLHSATEFRAHASVGHGELDAVLQDACDRWFRERAVTRLPAVGTGWGYTSRCTDQARNAALVHDG